MGGTTEICGNTTGRDSELQLQEFKVFFRSSDNNNNHRGFVMLIICFQPMEADFKGTFDKVLNCD